MDPNEPIDLTPATVRPSADGFVAEPDLTRLPSPPPFGAAIYSLPPGGTSRLDQHVVPELWLVTAGTGVLHTAPSRRIGPGSVIAFTSSLVHQVENDGTTTLTLVSIWWSE